MLGSAESCEAFSAASLLSVAAAAETATARADGHLAKLWLVYFC